MNIKIIQPAGLGDILFCSKIAYELISEGHDVYWPVIPQYSWIDQYIHVDHLHWTDSDNIEKVIDLQSAGRVFPEVPIMDAKYKMVGMNYDGWQSYIWFERNYRKENELFNKVVTSSPYCLVGEVFASPPYPLRRDVEKSTSCANVSLELYEEFTPFDWCKVIEEAEELRLVDTCYTHIIETLKTKATVMKLYSRDGKFYTDHLWRKKWEYVI
jgi:hypothetical protein